MAYGAALHLMIATTLFPNETEGQGYSKEAHSILDEMISQGNMIAAARKTELTHLEGLSHELEAQIKRHGLQKLNLTTPDRTEDEVDFPPTQARRLDETVADPASNAHAIYGDTEPSLTIPPLSNGVDLLNEFGISSYEFQSIIEQIGGGDSGVLEQRPSWEHSM